MDFTAPISKFMTRKLTAVMPTDQLSMVKEIFDIQRIHHIPVVRYKKLEGIISKTDLMYFLRGVETTPYDRLVEENRLQHFTAENIMTKGIATLESTDRVNVALQLFNENLFHAIPIVDNGELVGMLTTFDIIKSLLDEDNARMKAK